jgi:hypothetical protein
MRIPLLLQWGRDLSIAETWIAADASRLGAQRLQWGRDLSIAETAVSMTAQIQAAKLQWGRDLSIAETASRLNNEFSMICLPVIENPL